MGRQNSQNGSASAPARSLGTPSHPTTRMRDQRRLHLGPRRRRRKRKRRRRRKRRNKWLFTSQDEEPYENSDEDSGKSTRRESTQQEQENIKNQFKIRFLIFVGDICFLVLKLSIHPRFSQILKCH